MFAAPLRAICVRKMSWGTEFHFFAEAFNLRKKVLMFNLLTADLLLFDRPFWPFGEQKLTFEHLTKHANCAATYFPKTPSTAVHSVQQRSKALPQSVNLRFNFNFAHIGSVQFRNEIAFQLASEAAEA